MIVKTRKYQLKPSLYIKKGLLNLLNDQWWVFLIYIALCSGYFIIPNIWWIIGSSIALFLYFLFWLIQFGGMTQVEQGRYMFERLSYEVSSQQILIKVSSNQGMPMKWENIKKAYKKKDGFLFKINKVQIIFLPFKVFNSDNEIRFVESVLRRKGYIK